MIEQRGRPANHRRGLTLVEMLVVIAILGLVAMLLLPAVQSARESARRVTCTNHMRQLAIAVDRYQGSLGCYPRARMKPGTGGLGHISFVAVVLPYFEQDAMFRQVDFSQDFGGSTAMNATVPGLRCPSAPPTQTLNIGLPGSASYIEGTGANHYLGIMGASDGCPQPTASPYDMGTSACSTGGNARTGILLADNETRSAGIQDGASMTFLLGEFSLLPARPWVAGAAGADSIYSAKNLRWPLNTQLTATLNNDQSFRSPHPGGVMFGCADGSVRFFDETTELTVLKALATRARGGRETIVSLP